MEKKRKPSIFDFLERSFKRMMEGFPSFRMEPWPSEFRDPFEEMMERFEKEGVPKEFEELIKEEETPTGKIKRYGPFIYGFSYKFEPGKEPEIREFGNIKPSARELTVLPEGEREPFTDVIERKDHYEIVSELPGVTKEEIDLEASKNSLVINTTGERKYSKTVDFDKVIDTEDVKATYKNGVLSVIVKKAKEKGKKVQIK